MAKFGPYSAVIADLDEEILRKPDFAEAWAAKAWVKAQLKDYRDALIDYDTALKLAERAGNKRLKADIESAMCRLD